MRRVALLLRDRRRGACPIELGGPGDVLVYFLSLAFSTRYAPAPLSQLALLLRGELKIDLGPLTTFADRDVEVEADQVELDRVWQDAAPLAATLRAVTHALAAGDERVAQLTADAPDLEAGCSTSCAWSNGRRSAARACA